MLYHARLPGVSGGFVGVDVFFVISGYLITRLLLADLDAGRFSIATFYERRVRRIFPALFSVLIVSTVIAAIVLMPADLAQFGQSMLATTFFFANQFFLSLSGYFDSAAETKPLLHMWSLAVEEQFYLLFPLALWAAYRFVKPRILALTWATWTGTLLLSLWMVRAHPDAAFYLAAPRAWELLTGSLLAMGAFALPRSEAARNGLALLGGALILVAVFGFTRTTAFPGFAALLPCIGSGLIIHAGSGGGSSAVGRALAWRPMTQVGLLSYSLYLWHWPLLVFAEYYAANPLTLSDRLLVMGLALVVSYLSWRFVEGPFRGRTALLPGRRAILTFGGGCMLAGTAVAAVLIASRGLPTRFDPSVMAVARVRSEGVNFQCESDKASPPCRSRARAIWERLARLPASRCGATPTRCSMRHSCPRRPTPWASPASCSPSATASRCLASLGSIRRAPTTARDSIRMRSPSSGAPARLGTCSLPASGLSPRRKPRLPGTPRVPSGMRQAATSRTSAFPRLIADLAKQSIPWSPSRAIS